MRDIKWKMIKYRMWEIVMLHYRDSSKGDDTERRQRKGTILRVNEEKNWILRREEVGNTVTEWNEEAIIIEMFIEKLHIQYASY